MTRQPALDQMRFWSLSGWCRVIIESSMVIDPSLRNWPNVRVTVSRVVHAIDAISSWVRRSGNRYPPFTCSPIW